MFPKETGLCTLLPSGVVYSSVSAELKVCVTLGVVILLVVQLSATEQVLCPIPITHVEGLAEIFPEATFTVTEEETGPPFP